MLRPVRHDATNLTQRSRPDTNPGGLVRAEGLEPPRLSPLEPKSSASTNSATPARGCASRRPPGRGSISCGARGAAKKFGRAPSRAGRWRERVSGRERFSGGCPSAMAPVMRFSSRTHLTRRAFAAGLGATLLDLRAGACAQALAPEAGGFMALTAAPKRMKLHPEASVEAGLWTLNGELPGSVLRVRHGDELRVRFRNRTERPLALHWHGVRNVNPMDGIGGLTQPPVPAGQDFDYRFTPPDAGTYLVRPVVIGGSAEPTERGLSAILVVEEREPAKIDSEHVLLVDDWRLNPDGSLAPFGNALEAATTGRLGNWLAVAGKQAPNLIEAAPGSRLRLRLLNACNARLMRIRFDELKAYVIAVDGQPTDTFEPLRSTLPFSPGSRYDLLIDLPPQPGAKGALTALIGQGAPLLTVTTTGEPAAAKRPALPAIAPLAPNKLLPPAIKLQDATRRDLVIAGGARRGANGEPVFD